MTITINSSLINSLSSNVVNLNTAITNSESKIANEQIDDPSVANLSPFISDANQASNNASDGISFTNAVTSSLLEVTDILSSIESLVNESNEAGKTVEEIADIQSQIDSLTTQAQSVVSNTNFNGQNVFSDENTFSFEVGVYSNQNVEVTGTNPLSSLATIDVTTADGRSNAINNLSAVQAEISLQTSSINAAQDTLNVALDNANNISSDLSNTSNSIKDAELAAEQIVLLKNQLQLESSLAALSQGIAAQQNISILFSSLNNSNDEQNNNQQNTSNLANELLQIYSNRND